MADKEYRHLISLINPDNTSVITNKSSITEKVVRKCFKPRYHWYHLRKIKNKGAFLILLWSYFVSSLYFYISYNALKVQSYFVFVMIQTMYCGLDQSTLRHPI